MKNFQTKWNVSSENSPIFTHHHPFTSATCACPIWVGHCTNTSVHPHSVYSPEGHTELTEEVHKCKIPIVTSVRREDTRLGASMTDLRRGQE